MSMKTDITIVLSDPDNQTTFLSFADAVSVLGEENIGRVTIDNVAADQTVSAWDAAGDPETVGAAAGGAVHFLAPNNSNRLNITGSSFNNFSVGGGISVQCGRRRCCRRTAGRRAAGDVLLNVLRARRQGFLCHGAECHRQRQHAAKQSLHNTVSLLCRR